MSDGQRLCIETCIETNTGTFHKRQLFEQNLKENLGRRNWGQRCCPREVDDTGDKTPVCTGPGTVFRNIEKEAQHSWDELINELHLTSWISRMA